MMAAEISTTVRDDGFQRRGQAWFCTTGLPSDIVIVVQGMSFHLHKFPLTSRSGRLERLVSEDAGAGADGVMHVRLEDVPGGADTFEVAVKFCYGVKVELNSKNLAPLRCAADYLEMTEEHGEGNLILKTEGYLSNVILRSWKDSVIALETCRELMPLADHLGIVKRCVDSIAVKASTTPPAAAVLGWPINKHATSEWWYEDMATLSIGFYKRVIAAIDAKGISADAIADSVIHYANKFIPGLTKRQGVAATLSFSCSTSDQKELLETMESLLPRHHTSHPNTTRFLFGLLRTANILSASESCKTSLEHRIGRDLEHATLDDLLMPSYSYTMDTLYDVDCVCRILQIFIDSQKQLLHVISRDHEETLFTGSPPPSPVCTVAKLLDRYLAEVAPDANLKPNKFLALAEALPADSRNFDDGLYRAIDIYLKAHPWVSDEERERVCSVMDSQKLTLEACTHAAQNERLPMRVVVQVLFFEQLQLRNAIAGAFTAADGSEPSNLNSVMGIACEGVVPEDPRRENQILKMDMNTMRSRVQELERVCSSMRHAVRKMDQKTKESKAHNNNWGRFISKKFSCKFGMQVCQSQERDEKKGRNMR